MVVYTRLRKMQALFLHFFKKTVPIFRCRARRDESSLLIWVRVFNQICLGNYGPFDSVSTSTGKIICCAMKWLSHNLR